MLGDYTVFGIIVLIVSLLVAMTIHEAMHAFVGLKLGDDTAAEQGRISLNPLKHIDPFATVILPIITLVLFHAPILAAKPVPFNPDRVKFDEFGAALIALAGPVSNLVLAILGAAVIRLLSDSVITDILTLFVSLNVILFIFNMIPIPPLDGSRVLFALAPEPVQDFMKTIEPFGIFVVFGLVLFAGFGTIIVNINQAILNFLL